MTDEDPLGSEAGHSGPLPSRSIFSYFGTGPPPAQPGPSLVKKRPKKQDTGDTQARFLPNSGGVAWVIGKQDGAVSQSEDKEAVNADGRKRARMQEGKVDAQELSEVREMGKKAKAAGKAKRAKRGVEDTELDGAESEGKLTSSLPMSGSAFDALITNGVTTPRMTPSAAKRQRGSPREAQSDLSTSGTSSVKRSETSPSVVDIALAQPAAGPSRHRSSSPSDVIFTGHLRSDRAVHPIFARTAAACSKGASQADPIDVDVLPTATESAAVIKSGPKKHVFASDRKATHSFFTRVPDGTGGSRATSVFSDAPTETSGSSKVKEKAKVHDFFQINGKGKAGLFRNGWGNGVQDGEEWLPPWPGRIWPCHEGARGASPLERFLPRRTMSKPSLTSDDFWLPTSKPPIGPPYARSDSTRPTQSTVPFIDLHPAVASVATRPAGSTREMWCDHYRPQRACEVLGNELEATYLSDWLCALQVGHTDGAGPRVTRRVKRRRAQALDGWIVDDIGLFGGAQEEEDEEFEEIEEPPIGFGERPTCYPPFTHRLANTILLTGPHGCGKSAAVHATAHELGWDVFEVYPGIGKRTGANLMSLVGDVGRNHMVVKAKEKEDKGVKSFFSKREATPMPSGSQGSAADPIEIDEEPKELATGDNSKFKQSLILLEEVDILFEEESTFWPAVISLIAESRRPVVLTCNDPDKLPLAQLPLQTILQFVPPPTHLAIPYLQAIVRHEQLQGFDVAALVHQCMSAAPDLLDQPLPPNGHEPLPTLDLRRAIMQMQLDRGGSPQLASDFEEVELNHLAQRADVMSFVDAFVDERAWTIMQPTADDLLGVTQLVKPEVEEFKPALAGYDLGGDISACLLDLAGGALPSSGDLQTARTHYIRSLLPLLDPLIPLSSHLLPHPSLLMDQLPAIQLILRADDMLQAAEEAAIAVGGERRNRKTGRPVRSTNGGEYTSYFELDRAILQAARDAQLN